MPKVLITGGLGFVGYHLSNYLAQKGYEIVIVSLSIKRLDDAFTTLLKKPNITLIEGDVTEMATFEKIGGGYDCVYHLATINGFKQFREIPHEVLRVGVLSTINVLEWFRTQNGKPDAKILFTSSNEVYLGALESFGTLPLPTPENVPGVVSNTYDPRWSYGGHKLINELFFIHYAKAYNLRMVIVRPHYLFGPRAGSEPMIPRMIAKIQNHTEPFERMGGGDSRSYCYVEDAVEAMVLAMEAKATDGGTYNIGSSEETTIKNLTETLFELMGWHPQIIEEKPSPDGKINRFLPDISKIKKDTGWEAKTPLSEGLKKTIEWYS